MKFNLKLTNVTVENITIGGVELNSEYTITELHAVASEIRNTLNYIPNFAQKIVETIKLLEEETEPKTENIKKEYLYPVYYFAGDSTAFYEKVAINEVAIPTRKGNYELDGVCSTESVAKEHVNELINL